MATIDIRKKYIAVNVRAELEEFDWGRDAKWSHDKLIARSPFRDDETPSFFVRLEPYQDYPAGIWSDSGASDMSWYKGDFVKLLSFLRHETRGETEDYLLDKYAPREGKRVIVPPHIPRNRTYPTIDDSIIEVLPSPYLRKRGISDAEQLRAGTGKGPYRGYVALPWRFPDGRLMNVKYRATKGKMFFYEDDAYPIGRLVWGADSVRESTAIMVVEAEIDALSWRTAGFEAVATGHGAISEEQVDILLQLPAAMYIAAGDNDLVGKRFNEQLKRVLGKRRVVGELDWQGIPHKDANDILRAEGIDGLGKLGQTAHFPKRFQKIPQRR